MQAVIEACQQGRLRAKPCAVISNNSQAEVLAKARQAEIPGYHLSLRTHALPAELDTAILRVFQQHNADLIILAGYLKKLGPQTLRYYKDRVLNIHPALLPEFGGQGMYGAAVHEAVLRAGEKETGVTIHLVDEEYDQGEILSQCRIPVRPGDTVATLSQRVLEREHTFLVETLKRIIEGEIALPQSYG